MKKRYQATLYLKQPNGEKQIYYTAKFRKKWLAIIGLCLVPMPLILRNLIISGLIEQSIEINEVLVPEQTLFRKKIIYRNDHEPYLIRYSIFTCRWFAIKIHQILLSDHDCHHDHPWSFITLLLKGGYVEHTPKGSKLYGPGNILYRPAEYIHRLEIHQPCWSFVITFKKVRKWGFFTNAGWVEWFNYSPSNSCE